MILLGKRRRFLAAGLSLGVIAFYTILVGAGASVVRAALMGGLSLFAVQIGRPGGGLNKLRTDQNGWIELTTDGGANVGGGGEEVMLEHSHLFMLQASGGVHIASNMDGLL